MLKTLDLTKSRFEFRFFEGLKLKLSKKVYKIKLFGHNFIYPGLHFCSNCQRFVVARAFSIFFLNPSRFQIFWCDFFFLKCRF